MTALSTTVALTIFQAGFGGERQIDIGHNERLVNDESRAVIPDAVPTDDREPAGRVLGGAGGEIHHNLA